MSLDEFIDMVNQSGVVNDTFGSREISPLFNLSMMTQKNELDLERHYNMIPVEFIEAIARVSDKLQNLPDFFPELQPQSSHKLDKRIESYIMVLSQNCLPKAISEPLEKQIRKEIEAELTKPKKTKYSIKYKQY